MDAPSTSRKFIDLIHKASDKWANWDPPYEIKVGDYGKLDKQTGRFHKEGNVYDDTHIYKDESIAKLVKDHPPKPAPREDVYIAASATVKRSDLQLSAEIGIPGLSEASIKGQWAFGSRRGALLIMDQPFSIHLPRDTILRHLAEVEVLKGLFLVTEVFLCPAYCLYLSSKNCEVVDLALLTSFPVPYAPGVTGGGETKGKWWTQNTNGLFRSAIDHHGRDKFTPLYMLRQIRSHKSFFGRRGEKVPLECEDDNRWCGIQTPWNPLDDDGNEEEFEDIVSDD